MYENQLDNFESKLSNAEDEWKEIASVEPQFNEQKLAIAEKRESKAFELIPFNEAWNYFQMKDMNEYLKLSKPTLEWSGSFAVFRHFCKLSTLQKNLVDERNLIFAVAASPLISTDEVQLRVLQTIYKRLLNNVLNVPLYGKHWEDIGFQGSDPATDLRGVGFWGLMNLLYFLMCPETFFLARSIYKLSRDETQHFPFVAMSLNITAIVLKVLREEKLNGICNKRKEVVNVVNDLFVAAFRRLFLVWKNEHRTISHSGYVLKDIEFYVRKHPKRLLYDLKVYLDGLDVTKRLRRSSNTKQVHKRNVEFSSIGDIKST